MARSRRDSGGNLSNSQMRVNFTQQYRRQMGKQDKKKCVKNTSDSGKPYELKVDGWTLYRDVCIMIAVLSILVFCFYIAFNVLIYELHDVFPTMTSVTVD